MRFQQVCIESLGYTLPEEILSSDEIERRLAPLYQRLRLPEGEVIRPRAGKYAHRLHFILPDRMRGPDRYSRAKRRDPRAARKVSYVGE